jgi:hypothetical protein
MGELNSIGVRSTGIGRGNRSFAVKKEQCGSSWGVEGSIEIILPSNTNQGEEGVTPRIG